MVTASGSNETVADMMQAIYDTLTHADLTAWSPIQEAEINLTASTSETEWWQSGWVFQHSNSGLYMLVTCTWYQDREVCIRNDDTGGTGISFCCSDDWVQEDPQGGNSGNIAPGSPGWPGDLENTDWPGVRNPLDARDSDLVLFTEAFLDTEFVNNRDSISAVKLSSGTTRKGDTVVDYNIMANDDMLVVAAEGETYASWFAFEDVSGRKFFDDGVSPSVVRMNRVGHNGSGDTTLRSDAIYPNMKYGWNSQWMENYDGGAEWEVGILPGNIGSYGGPVGYGEWGDVNPDPNDDTYFYRPAVLYQSSDQEVPVAEIESVHPAEWTGSLSHGDTVTVTEGTYKIIHYRTSAMDWPIRLAMRWE